VRVRRISPACCRCGPVACSGAAVFTPQAAAAINVMAPTRAQRGRAITFIFLGWSLASVLGMPLHSYIGETFGWRWAFALVARAERWPRRRRVAQRCPTACARRRCRCAAGACADAPAADGHGGRHGPVSAAGQFTLFAYLAPYYRQVLGISRRQVSFAVLVVRRLRRASATCC
jgi:DHA1 family inner membrane transport protein